MNDTVAEECVLHVDINSEIAFDTIVSPSDIKEFVYGNLLTEGLMLSKTELQDYQERRRGDVICVSLSLPGLKERRPFLKRNYNLVWTECGSLPTLRRAGERLGTCESRLRLHPADMFKIHGAVRDMVSEFKATGAFHYAFLFDGNMDIDTYACDIGRHNAVDKTVGKHLLMSARPFNDLILYTTGRLTADIVLKCIRLKLPVLVSRGAPLLGAIELARKHELTLIGFLRGNRYNVYSNERLFCGDPRS